MIKLNYKFYHNITRGGRDDIGYDSWNIQYLILESAITTSHSSFCWVLFNEICNFLITYTNVRIWIKDVNSKGTVNCNTFEGHLNPINQKLKAQTSRPG